MNTFKYYCNFVLYVFYGTITFTWIYDHAALFGHCVSLLLSLLHDTATPFTILRMIRVTKLLAGLVGVTSILMWLTYCSVQVLKIGKQVLEKKEPTKNAQYLSPLFDLRTAFEHLACCSVLCWYFS